MIQQLLDFIARLESRGDYNVVWNGIKQSDKPKKPLTSLTINEVLAWQDSIDPKYRSEAAGAYQILEDTLRDIYQKVGFSGKESFDNNTQDRLAIYLCKQRGLDKYLSGKMSAEDFCNSLAREWASLPIVSGPNKGKSFYDKDSAGNKALTNAENFLSIVRSLKVEPTVESTVEPTVEKPVSWLTTLINFILSLFKRNPT